MALPKAFTPERILNLDSMRLIGLLLITAGAVYYVLLLQVPSSKADVRKFTGSLTAVEGGAVTLQAVEGDAVTLHGAFYPIPGPVPEHFRSGRDFTFRTDDSTRILAILLSRPSPDKILSHGGRYKLKLNELPRKEGPGSLAELKSLIGKGNVHVEASFSSSVLNAENPVASSVIYRYLPTPDFKNL